MKTLASHTPASHNPSSFAVAGVVDAGVGVGADADEQLYAAAKVHAKTSSNTAAYADDTHSALPSP